MERGWYGWIGPNYNDNDNDNDNNNNNKGEDNDGHLELNGKKGGHLDFFKRKKKHQLSVYSAAPLCTYVSVEVSVSLISFEPFKRKQ